MIFLLSARSRLRRSFARMAALAMLAVTAASGCIVRTERDMCYMDIKYGEKSNGFEDPCMDLGIYEFVPAGNPSNPALERDFGSFYLLLCVSTILEAQKCESKSRWIPKIDARA